MSTNFSVKSTAYSDMMRLIQQNQPSNAVNLLEKKEDEGQNSSVSVKVADVETKKTGNALKITGISAGGAILLGILGLSLFSKGASGSLYRRLQKHSADLKKKAFDIQVDYKDKGSSLMQRINMLWLKITEPVTNFMQSSSNITTFKDCYFTKFLKKLGLTPVINGINKRFRTIVETTKKNHYVSAESSKSRFCNYIDSLGIKSKPEAEETLGSIISSKYGETFSMQQHMHRSEEMWDGMNGFYGEVLSTLKLRGENGLLKNKERLKSYITMDMSAERRCGKVAEILKEKKAISNNIDDNYTALRKGLDELKLDIDIKDKTAVELIKQLDSRIARYKTINGANEVSERAAVIKEIKKLLEDIKTQMGSSKNLEQQMKHLETTLNTDKGSVQEALTKIKEIYGKNSTEYKHAKKLADEFNNNLNRAINSESLVYEKFAEMQLGSALTDVCGILLPLALGTGLVLKEKDKDQKITNALTKGIPVIGGIASWYYGTTRMFTGAKNLAFGLTTGAILSVLGAKVDDIYKKARDKNRAFLNEFEMLKKAQAAIKETFMPDSQNSVNAVKNVPDSSPAL